MRELYEHDGKLSWSAERVGPAGSTWLELNEDLSRMGTALAAAQFLDLAAEPPRLDLERMRLWGETEAQARIAAERALIGGDDA